MLAMADRRKNRSRNRSRRLRGLVLLAVVVAFGVFGVWNQRHSEDLAAQRAHSAEEVSAELVAAFSPQARPAVAVVSASFGTTTAEELVFPQVADTRVYAYSATQQQVQMTLTGDGSVEGYCFDLSYAAQAPARVHGYTCPDGPPSIG